MEETRAQATGFRQLRATRALSSVGLRLLRNAPIARGGQSGLAGCTVLCPYNARPDSDAVQLDRNTLGACKARSLADLLPLACAPAAALRSMHIRMLVLLRHKASRQGAGVLSPSHLRSPSRRSRQAPGAQLGTRRSLQRAAPAPPPRSDDGSRLKTECDTQNLVISDATHTEDVDSPG